MSRQQQLLLYVILGYCSGAIFWGVGLREASATSSYRVTDRQTAIASEMQSYDLSTLSISFGKNPEIQFPQKTDVPTQDLQINSIFDPCRMPTKVESAPARIRQEPPGKQGMRATMPIIVTPEPGTLALLSMGLMMLLFRLRRRR